MLEDLHWPDAARMMPEHEVRAGIEAACAGAAAAGLPCRCGEIGRSENDRPLLGVVMGEGSVAVSLISGAHADEPVGSITLLHLIRALSAGNAAAEALLQRYCFCIVPHANPDGAEANRSWIEQWPDPVACLKSVERELPGRDIEFGYPAGRVENAAVSAFLSAHGPFALHMSLHGMLVSEGGLLLIERTWADRTKALRQQYADALRNAGLRLFDHDRGGEKGFEYLGPGFATTPRGAAMREHFLACDDPQTAALFRDSSMEYAQSLGGDPLCLVTELPLFVLENQVVPPEPGRPTTHLLFRSQLPQWRLQAQRGGDLREALAPFGIRALDVAMAIRLQRRALSLGLTAIT